LLFTAKFINLPPDLQLPSQPKSVTTHRPVPNHTAGNRGTCVSSMPKAVTWKQAGQDANLRPLGSRANALLYATEELIGKTMALVGDFFGCCR